MSFFDGLGKGCGFVFGAIIAIVIIIILVMMCAVGSTY